MRSVVIACLGVVTVALYVAEKMFTVLVKEEYMAWARPLARLLTGLAGTIDPSKAKDRRADLHAVHDEEGSGLPEGVRNLLGALYIRANAWVHGKWTTYPSIPLPPKGHGRGDPRALAYLEFEASFETRLRQSSLVATEYGWTAALPRDTSSSCAAYMELRELFCQAGTKVRAICSRAVWDGLGAVELITPAGQRLLLTGMASGHGGEGGKALAALLADLGFFDSRGEALRWTTSHHRRARWSLTTTCEPRA